MSKNKLGMLDDYGSRRRIIPAEVRGRLRSWRTSFYFVLLIIFLALPWIRLNGRQLLHLDIVHRRFEIFGRVFLSHDAPLLFFIIATLILVISLVTAVWGRVWCGWACPQTVFIDLVYRKIEMWTEGNYIKRRQLQAAPVSVNKILRLTLKWLLFLIFSSAFAHSFIAYFVGSKELVMMMNAPPGQNYSYFILVSVATLILTFNFGWFREQFCIIMCPYGKFQSLLLDNQSIGIVYDDLRGEPRKGTPDTNRKGDCVSCNRCVQVCPTAIDIRDGLQLECIGCTACIDACDEIMTKLNKPTGLISYRALGAEKINYFRPRLLAYAALTTICLSSLSFTLAKRQPFSVAVLRATDLPYQLASDGTVINHFKVHLHNQSHNKETFTITSVQDQFVLTQVPEVHELAAGQSHEVHIFIRFPLASLGPERKVPIRLLIRENSTNEERTIEVYGIGP